jgi:hypothetical protein
MRNRSRAAARYSEQIFVRGTGTRMRWRWSLVVFRIEAAVISATTAAQFARE